MRISDRKRITIVAVLIFCLVIIGLVYTFYKNYREKQYLSGLLALPQDAIIYFKGENFDELYQRLHQTALWQKMIQNESVKSIHEQIIEIDSLINQNRSLKKNLFDREVIISLHKTAVKKFDILAITQTNDKISVDDINSVIKRIQKGKLITRNFENTNIYDIQESTKKSQLAFAFIDGILLLSKNPILVEDAIRSYQINKHSQKKVSEKTFQDRKVENWYINYNNLYSIFSTFITNETKDYLKGLNQLGDLGSYELDFGDNHFSLRGNISHSAQNDHSFISLFYDQRPQKTEIQKIISQRTSILLAFFVQDFSTYYSRFIDRLKAQDKWEDYRQKRRDIELKYDISIEKDFVPLVKNQFALTISEPISSDISASMMAIVKVKDTDRALFQFESLISANESNDNSPLESKSNHRDFEIFKADSTQLLEVLFGPNFSSINAPYYTSIDGYLVFSNQLSFLQKFIDDFLDEKTLNADPEFNKFSENLVSESNFLFYINPMRSLKIPGVYCNQEFSKKFSQNLDYYKKIGSFAFQITNNNNSIYNQIIATYSPKKQVIQENIWDLELASACSVRPNVVKNHNDGSNELLVFDDSNNIYLITAQGKILWNRTLDSKIMGEAFMVDLYNNNKIQYLFTTEKYLYLIDRKGRNVANYPITLSSNAIVGLNAFDFKNDNNHKYFVGCDNKSVFGYYKSGKPLEGWNPKRLDDNLEHPVKYFKHGGKVYLFGVSRKGTFYMWDLKGREVFKPIKLQTRITNPFKIKFAKNTYLASVDTSGKTYFIYLDGKVEEHKFGDCSGNVYFDFLDINSDGGKELVYAENNQILAVRPNGETVFTIELNNSISSRPEYIYIDKNYYIAYLNQVSNQIYLIDIKGRLVSGFPIMCNSPFQFFDLNNDERLELIGGKDKRLFMARF